MRSLNRKYKNIDRSTDVLSFEIGTLKEFGSPASLGEVCISPDKALQQSRTLGTTFERELLLYVIHGILHLVGYDDRKPQDRMRMRKKEKELLNSLCKEVKLSRVLMQP